MRDLPAEAARILREETTFALATADASGAPAAAPVYFVADEEGVLYWLSARASLHSRDAEVAGWAAGAVWAATPHWREIRGVQLEGAVRRLDAPGERTRALALYRAKFPLPDELAPAIEASAVYALRPTWLRLVDNRGGLGRREERGTRCRS